MGRVHDVILFYTKTNRATRNEIYQPYSHDYVDSFYRYKDPDGRRYRLDNIAGPGGAAKGNPQYEFLGVTRYWRYSKERMQELYEQGRIVQTKSAHPQILWGVSDVECCPVANAGCSQRHQLGDPAACRACSFVAASTGSDE